MIARPYQQYLSWLLYLRWAVLAGVVVLLVLLEQIPHMPSRFGAWELLLCAGLLNLAYHALLRLPRLSLWVLGGMFVLDTLLVSVWAWLTGGAMSFYLPLYLLVLGAASLLLPWAGLAALAAFMVLCLCGVFLLDYSEVLHFWVPLENQNFAARMLHAADADFRKHFYVVRTLQWFFYILLFSFLGGMLSFLLWRREEALRREQQRMENQKSLLQLGELATRLAHDLNTPLGVLSGRLELLLAKLPESSPWRDRLQQLQDPLEQAIRAVRSVLDVNRRLFLETEWVFLPPLLQDVVLFLQDKIRQCKGKVVLDLPKDLPPVLGSQEDLRQVFLNLIQNALDSLADGGMVWVRAFFRYQPVRLSPEDRRGHVVVVVQDDGRGMDVDEQARIFEPFYTTKAKGKGSGLGLSIVKRILEEHGGEIEVFSKPREGTTFTLRFPTQASVASPREKETGVS